MNWPPGAGERYGLTRSLASVRKSLSSWTWSGVKGMFGFSRQRSAKWLAAAYRGLLEYEKENYQHRLRTCALRQGVHRHRRRHPGRGKKMNWDDAVRKHLDFFRLRDHLADHDVPVQAVPDIRYNASQVTALAKVTDNHGPWTKEKEDQAFYRE
jgi:hypothetical protein